MTAIEMLAMQPWVERLGLVLVHALWQGAVVGAVYAAVHRWGGRSVGPNRRYVLACGALIAMVLAALATWVMLAAPSSESVAGSFAAPLSAAQAGAEQSVVVSFASDASPGSFLSWVVALWFIGATAFSMRLLGGWMLSERLRFTRVHAPPVEWQRTLDHLRLRISVARPVRLLVSGLVEAPAAMGWLRPIVLVPAGVLAGLPAAQMEALLLHELAHIRRHDYLVHILQSAVEAVFFYHPAVWWISGHLRAERELCCDDIAVSATGDAVLYARALAELASTRFVQPAVMAANGGSVADRIARLLGQPPRSRRTPLGVGTVLAPLLLAMGAWAVFAQPAVRPEFEVASIKPSVSRRVTEVRPLPGRLAADATLPVLIQYAYGVQPFQIVGAAGWMGAERFEINATTDGSVSRDRMFLMLRSLLENRFQLMSHRETRELPVYSLVAARSGLKLPPPKDGGCVDSPADAAAEWTGGGRMAAPGELAPGKARCGSAAIVLGPKGARLQGGKMAMPELARMLSTMLDRSVLDRTGFTGLFDLQMDFVPDESTPGMPPPPPGAGVSGASVPQALREQLGLQLESTKGPVDVIIIDHAERPSAN